MSTIVTDKEKAILIKKQLLPTQCSADVCLSSPKPPPGIVQSMRKFYTDNFADKVLNRSHSFSAAMERNNKDVEEEPTNADNKENMLNIQVETSPSSEASVSPNSDIGSEGRKSLRLFRSRSWSMRRNKSNKDDQLNSRGPMVGPIKRCSPSYSTKSADSGFSDSGESGKTAATSGGAGLPQRSSVSSQETQEEDLASLESPTSPTNSSRHLESPKIVQQQECSAKNSFMSTKSKKPPMVFEGAAAAGADNREADTTPTARSKVSNTLGNIASMQEGLRLKRQQLEEGDKRSLAGAMGRQSSTNLLIRAQDEDEKNKISKQFYFSEIRR